MWRARSVSPVVQPRVVRNEKNLLLVGLPIGHGCVTRENECGIDRSVSPVVLSRIVRNVLQHSVTDVLCENIPHTSCGL